MNRSRLLLILVLILIGAAWYAWQESPRQQKVTDRSEGSTGTIVEKKTSNGEGEEQLDFSGGKKLSFKEPKRDLFRSLYRKPVIAKIVSPPPPPPKPVVALPKPVVAPPPPPPPPKKTPRFKPIPVFRVLGFLEKEGAVTVFLAGTAGDIHLLKQGDRFADDLLVRDLSVSEVVISRGMDDPGVTLKVSDTKIQRLNIKNVPSGRPSAPVFQEQEKQPPATKAGST